MIRYITRHGQVDANRFINGNAMYPLGDPPLSELGREQAKRLGERLKSQDFHGLIISSPYARTMETAQIVAEITDTQILPYAPIREIMQREETAQAFVGMKIDEIKAKYSRVLPDAELEWPWWTPHVEDNITVVRPRVKAGLPALEKYADRELLFVGHGASSNALLYCFDIPADPDPRRILYNCCLCAFDPEDPDFKPYRFNTTHLPFEMTTSNYKTCEELDAEFYEKPYEPEIALPQGYETLQGERVLHIGDTFSKNYPYYKKLIELVKPDVIIHTGDMSDEVKVGRIPGTEYEYLTKIKVLLGYMQASGARIIIVPGNNDLPEEIHKLCPEAEIYQNNQELTFSGKQVRVGHQVMKMIFDRQYSLYGHGLTGEVWHYEDNVPGEPCRFNVIWGSFVYDFANDRYVRFPLPGKD